MCGVTQMGESEKVTPEQVLKEEQEFGGWTEGSGKDSPGRRNSLGESLWLQTSSGVVAGWLSSPLDSTLC